MTPPDPEDWLRASEARERLDGGARACGWRLGETQLRCLLESLARILARNRTLNLTRITDPEEALERHLLDSLAFGQHPLVSGSEALQLVDLGTGAGFPGLPLAVALPRSRVQLVESRRRKLAAVAEIAESLDIRNLHCRQGRLGELRRAGAFAGSRPSAVLARAVGSLSDLVRESHGLLEPGGELVCWKSARLTDAERRAGGLEAARRCMAPAEDIAYRLGERDLLLVRFVKGEGD